MCVRTCLFVCVFVHTRVHILSNMHSAIRGDFHWVATPHPPANKDCSYMSVSSACSTPDLGSACFLRTREVMLVGVQEEFSVPAKSTQLSTGFCQAHGPDLTKPSGRA